MNSNELQIFLDWIAGEIEHELDNPDTTICRDMRWEIEKHFRLKNKEVDRSHLQDLMVYNVVEEFMDRPFSRALSNLNFVQRENRHSEREMLLILPISTLCYLFAAEKNKKKIKLRYATRSFSWMINQLRLSLT